VSLIIATVDYYFNRSKIVHRNDAMITFLLALVLHVSSAERNLVV
jgi:hypothetical protein